MKIQHPAFPEVTRDVTHVGAWLASGWLALDDEGAPEVLTPCPTCGAVRDEPCMTATGHETARHLTRV